MEAPTAGEACVLQLWSARFVLLRTTLSSRTLPLHTNKTHSKLFSWLLKDCIRFALSTCAQAIDSSCASCMQVSVYLFSATMVAVKVVPAQKDKGTSHQQQPQPPQAVVTGSARVAAQYRRRDTTQREAATSSHALLQPVRCAANVPAESTLVLLSASKVTCKTLFCCRMTKPSVAVTDRGLAVALLVWAVAVAESDIEPKSKSLCCVARVTCSNSHINTQAAVTPGRRPAVLWPQAEA